MILLKSSLLVIDILIFFQYNRESI